MHLVFVMDPVSTVMVDLDTTFALMLEAQARGHRVDHCLVEHVSMELGEVRATVRQATMQRDQAAPVLLGPPEDIALRDVDAVLIRKDPPFNFEYHWLTLVLEHLRGVTTIVNDPRGLREANEKLYALHFDSVIPETLISSDKAQIKRFMEQVGGKAILKPLDGHGGDGVFALTTGDLNINALIETVTRQSRRVAVVQRFLPEVRKGDKRILLLEGKPLGAILRVPRSEDVRSNIHVGGNVVHTELDENDHEIVRAVAPRVVQDGLWFVGLDVIGGKLTEVNVTSPTGIQQMSRLSGQTLETRVIEALERKVRADVRRPSGSASEP